MLRGMGHDLIVRGARIVTPERVVEGDLAIDGGCISAIGAVTTTGRREIDAAGRIVTPGGVDPHCHIEQRSGMGRMNADTFETATRSALMGGTTTTISFAAQETGERLSDRVADYAARAARGAMTDHAFHLTVTDTGVEGFAEDLAALIAAGHRSIKLFTTYNIALSDRQILDVLSLARAHRRAGLHPRRNRCADRLDPRRAVGEGPHPSAASRALAPPSRRDRGGRTHDPVRRVPRRTGDALPHLHGRGGAGDPRRPRPRRARDGRDLPALPVHDRRRARPSRHRGREMDVLAAAADRGRSGRALGGARRRHARPRLLRPRALPLRRHRQARRRPRRPVPGHRQRSAGARDARAAVVRCARRRGRSRSSPVRAADGRGAGAALRPRHQGPDRRRYGRRPRALGPRAAPRLWRGRSA
jgi:hypothetical protein